MSRAGNGRPGVGVQRDGEGGGGDTPPRIPAQPSTAGIRQVG